MSARLTDGRKAGKTTLEAGRFIAAGCVRASRWAVTDVGRRTLSWLKVCPARGPALPLPPAGPRDCARPPDRSQDRAAARRGGQPVRLRLPGSAPDLPLTARG